MERADLRERRSVDEGAHQVDDLGEAVALDRGRGELQLDRSDRVGRWGWELVTTMFFKLSDGDRAELARGEVAIASVLRRGPDHPLFGCGTVEGEGRGDRYALAAPAVEPFFELAELLLDRPDGPGLRCNRVVALYQGRFHFLMRACASGLVIYSRTRSITPSIYLFVIADSLPGTRTRERSAGPEQRIVFRHGPPEGDRQPAGALHAADGAGHVLGASSALVICVGGGQRCGSPSNPHRRRPPPQPPLPHRREARHVVVRWTISGGMRSWADTPARSVLWTLLDSFQAPSQAAAGSRPAFSTIPPLPQFQLLAAPRRLDALRGALLR